MNEIVDTNIILRFLVGDNKHQQKKAIQYFKEAENGKRTLIIKPLVVAECCFVLESFYIKNRTEIATALEIFLAQKWLKVDDRKAMLALWTYYVKNFHFVDSYLLALTNNSGSSVLSFDKKINKAQTLLQ